ncbi:archease [Candidatus Woesearchaeota archaeon]|nr:archease [Candidatus Woesearchaeota archaeon]
MPYKFLEDVTTADIAFEATGKTLTELFSAAAQAVIDSMANPLTIKPNITREIHKKETSVEKLLFEFLEELIYLKDKDGMVYHDVKVKVDEKKLEVNATARGDSINPKQELRQDVKAVTMHYYTVEKKEEWKARIVLDI